MDLALNNLQGLICHKTQTTNQTTGHCYFGMDITHVQGVAYFKPYRQGIMLLFVRIFFRYFYAFWHINMGGVSNAKAALIERQ